MTRSEEIDALSTRAEALPEGSALRTALEELAFLLDDGPGPPHPVHGDEDWENEVEALRADVRRLEGVAAFNEELRACFPMPRGFR